MELSREPRLGRMLLYMIHAAFVEIRAAKSTNAAAKFADTFHNVPMRLAVANTDSEYELIYDEIVERARRNGIEDYVLKLRSLAENRSRGAQQ
jgi:hypothetical protein